MTDNAGVLGVLRKIGVLAEACPRCGKPSSCRCGADKELAVVAGALGPEARRKYLELVGGETPSGCTNSYGEREQRRVSIGLEGGFVAIKIPLPSQKCALCDRTALDDTPVQVLTTHLEDLADRWSGCAAELIGRSNIEDLLFKSPHFGPQGPWASHAWVEVDGHNEIVCAKCAAPRNQLATEFYELRNRQARDYEEAERLVVDGLRERILARRSAGEGEK